MNTALVIDGQEVVLFNDDASAQAFADTYTLSSYMILPIVTATMVADAEREAMGAAPVSFEQYTPEERLGALVEAAQAGDADTIVAIYAACGDTLSRDKAEQMCASARQGRR